MRNWTVKMKIISKEFEVVNDRKIKCTLTINPMVDLLNDCIATAYDVNDVSWMDKVTFVGYSVCHKDDEFSLEKGKKIAFSKEKIKAYKKFVKVFSDALRKSERQTEELIEDLKKLQRVLVHERIYVEGF